MFYLTIWRNMRILANYVLYTVVTILLNTIGIEIKGLFTQIVSQTVGSKEEPALEITADKFYRNSSFKEVLHNFTSTKFVQDKCDTKMVAYAAISGIYASKIVISNDNFKRSSTTLTLYVGTNFFGKLYLTDMEFINGYFIAVINHQLYTYDLQNDFTTIYNSTGIPSDYRVTHLSAFKCCHTLIYWCEVWRNTVMVYTYLTSTSHFYVSFDTAKTFKQVNLNTDVKKTFTNEYWIYSAAVMSTDLVSLFLVKEVSQPGEIVLLGVTINPNDIYHRSDESWVRPFYEKLYWLTADRQPADSNSIGMSYIESNYDSVIIWDHRALLYKSRFSDKPQQLQVYVPSASSSSLTNDYLNANEIIRGFHSYVTGEFVLITSQNRVIYGQESIKPQVIILNGIDGYIDRDTVIRFKRQSLIEFIHRGENDKMIDNNILYSSTLDLSRHLTKYAKQVPECPYQALVSDEIADFYELDISDVLTFKLILFPEAWSLFTLLTELSIPNSLYINSIANDNPHPEQFSQSYAIEAVLEVSIPRALMYDHTHSEQDEATEKPRVTALRMVTPETSIICSHKPQVVTHIGMGCLVERRMESRKEDRSCDKLRHGHTYVIAKGDYLNNFGLDPDPTEDKTVKYDFYKYGCPFRTYHSRPFTFDLHLYQGAEYLGPVTGTHVVYELYGVHKFIYSKKVGDLNCTYPPQSWREMALLAQAQNITNASSYWHRGNFMDCNEALSDLKENMTRLYTPRNDDYYELLGTTTNNSITFERNGIFVFEIIVADYRFSFCDLRAFMAVEVYGFQPTVPIPYFILMVACILVLMSIIMAFYAVKQRRVRRAQNLIRMMDEVDEVENLFKNVAGFNLVEEAPSRRESFAALSGLRERLSAALTAARSQP